MNKYVITISRETGSGGYLLVKELSKRLGISYYDRDLLRLPSEESGIHERLFGQNDERIGLRQVISSAKNVYTGEILPPDSDDYTSTKNLYSFQAKVIKELAEAESCIILGRCANHLLADRRDVLRIFLCASLEDRIKRIATIEKPMSERNAAKYIHSEDRRREDFYRYYTGKEWRDVREYDICLDTSRYGIEGSIDKIIDAIPLFSR